MNMMNDDEAIEMLTEWPVKDSDQEEPRNKKCLSPSKRKIGNADLNSDKVTKKVRRREDKEILANAAIAKWWRRNSQRLNLGLEKAVEGCHPNTLIKLIAKSQAGQEFIQGEIDRLMIKVKVEPLSDVHAALSSFLEKQGDIEEAIHHIKIAIHYDSEEKEYKWMLHKLERISQIKEMQTAGLEHVVKVGKFPQFKQVERRSTDGLSVEEFYHQYECTSTPVIITGLNVSTVLWYLVHIKNRAGTDPEDFCLNYLPSCLKFLHSPQNGPWRQNLVGKCNVTLKKPVKESLEWARLESSQTMSVSSYIDRVSTSSSGEKLYLFDWSLPLNCPALADEIVIPKYFAGDFLKRTKEGSLYRDSWPSLFVAPSNITSELHVDAFGSNFWMALFQGRKRWVFFPKSDTAYLYPEYVNSLDPVFDVDLSNPDVDKHPLLQLTSPMECVLQAGEVLFVPAGCPHRVENLEPSVAISSNFVDLSNLSLVKKELEINALLDVRSEELLCQLNSENFNDKMDFEIQNIPLTKF